MIESLIAWSVRRRWLVMAAAVILALAGGWAAYQTPVDAIPDLSETQIIVFANWPGRAPQDVEDQVTYPLSLQLGGMSGVRTLRASSEYGYSMIHIIFNEGVAIEVARRQVSERLAALDAPLPDEVHPRLAPDAPATGQIFWYTLEGTDYDLGELRTIQDWRVKHQLAAVDGVAEVASVGGFPVEFEIAVNPLELSARQLALADIEGEIAQAAHSAGGQALESPTAEYFVRTTSRLGFAVGAGEFRPEQAISDLQNLVIATDRGKTRLGEIARISLAPGPRRGVLEKDGGEAVGGVVLMRYGENPLAVTRRLKAKIADLQASLPSGVRIVTAYDRTPLIMGAVGTVTRTLLEAMAVATICVLLVLLHLRASFVIAITLPLAMLGSFLMMWLLRTSGMLDIQTNIMSLAGLTISIGVLVDSSIVMAENVMHALRGEFGDQPIHGDVRQTVTAACQQVGRPIFFSVLIMLVSFLPVFALEGLEGKMFRPLAVTKSLALLSVAFLAVTLVPALCTIFIRGRMRGERDSWLVRGLMDVYLPLLRWLLDRPAAMAWLMGFTFLLGLAPLGYREFGYPVLSLVALAAALIAIVLLAQTTWTRLALGGSLVLVALAADRQIQPLASEFLSPLDEGTVMDMPITAPRASVRQAADDLKARDMLLCRFPEVEMAMGKAGRADTPTDPAPIDMIETMVSFRPPEFWPKRKLAASDARSYAERTVALLESRQLIESLDSAARRTAVSESAAAAQARFDILMREVAWQRNQEHQREMERELAAAAAQAALRQLAAAGALSRDFTEGDVVLTASRLPSAVLRRAVQDSGEASGGELAEACLRILRETNLVGEVEPPALQLEIALKRRHRELWQRHVWRLNQDLLARAPGTFTRLVLEDLPHRVQVRDAKLQTELERLAAFRLAPAPAVRKAGGHHGTADYLPPQIDPLPVLDGLQQELTAQIKSGFLLWRKERADIVGFGGELDSALQMPGWTNVWTSPIQNRVDMLATGVNTTIGIRVLGARLEDVLAASEQAAELLRQMPGAVDVVADPVRGKGYLDIHVNRQAAAEWGVRGSDLGDVVETALGGKAVAQLVAGRERFPVRLRFPRLDRDDLEAIRRLPVPLRGQAAAADRSPTVALGQVADIRIADGPASIKSENGLLRNYVRLNVHNRDPVQFVREARQRLQEHLTLPQGVYLEWTGQFEHQVRARNRLWMVGPAALLLILAILYVTYRDFTDALLVLPAVAGALAGGLFLQWLLGYKTSVTVAMGYIACCGMAASTGIIMLVYLRDSVAQAGGLANLTLAELKEAVLRGAVHRLRPKLLTEATTILGLAPMLWATGIGSEVIRPMTAPVLGGILIADEVIDLLLPVMFYWVRRHRWLRLHAAAGAPAPQPAPRAANNDSLSPPEQFVSTPLFRN